MTTKSVPVYFGMIVDNGGDEPRPRSQIKYKIAIDFGGDTGCVEYENVQTTWKYPPETVNDKPFECYPREKSFGFLCSVQAPGMPVVMHFTEEQALADCDQNGSGQSNQRLKFDASGKAIPPDGDGGGSTQSPPHGGQGGAGGGDVVVTR